MKIMTRYQILLGETPEPPADEKAVTEDLYDFDKNPVLPPPQFRDLRYPLTDAISGAMTSHIQNTFITTADAGALERFAITFGLERHASREAIMARIGDPRVPESAWARPDNLVFPEVMSSTGISNDFYFRHMISGV